MLCISRVSMINDVLVAAEENPVIPEAEQNNHNYVLAFCAKEAGELGEAKGLFKKLLATGKAEEGVYSSYANILMQEGDKASAIKVLNEGGEKYPASSEILFAKINYYIGEDDQEELKNMLVKAIEAEPNNPSVHAALGNVYMQLFSEAYGEDRTSAKADEYFAESKKYFENAVNLDPEAFDATYSLGSLYFNRAVEDIKYASTLSIKEQDKYDAANTSATANMEKALPYFQKAESQNPNDLNTLIALSEIFARMNDFEKSKEFKARLQTVRDGGTNEKSYFNQ